MYYLSAFALLFTVAFTQCETPSNASNGTETDVAQPLAVAQTNDVISIEAYVDQQPQLQAAATAVFAGGCFWCTETALERIIGVRDVVSGYTDGDGKKTSYKAVSGGATDYTEAIYVFYDPTEVSYETLLKVFFTAHDPTQLNRQGPDRGTQYRGGIYPQSAEQRRAAEAYIAELEASGKYSDPIVTEVKDYRHFWVAEGYHQNYYVLNPNQPYIVSVSRPKVEKVMKAFPELIKPEYKGS